MEPVTVYFYEADQRKRRKITVIQGSKEESDDLYWRLREWAEEHGVKYGTFN